MTNRQEPSTPEVTEPGEPLPLWRQATTDVVALVVNTEIDVLLRHEITKEQALTALAAREEILGQFRRHRWLAIETARRVGASWDDVDRTLGRRPGQSRREYEQGLTGQKQFGLAGADRHDPGPSTGPQL
jgi:hypothetical protein